MLMAQIPKTNHSLPAFADGFRNPKENENN